MPTSTSIRLSDKVKPWVHSGIKEYATEFVIWDVAIGVFPEPSDGVGLLPLLVVYLELPGDSPETSVFSSTILSPHGVTRAYVVEAVKDAIDAMITERSSRQEKAEMLDLTTEDPSVPSRAHS